MTTNIRRRNRPTSQSQPGILDRLGGLLGTYADRGNPWFSRNHPAAQAWRDIEEYKRAGPVEPNDPFITERLSVISSSIGGSSNIPGGLLGIIKKTPLSLGALKKIKKLKPDESITADVKKAGPGGGTFIITKNPSVGQNYMEQWGYEGLRGGALKPEGPWRVSHIKGIESSTPQPAGHIAYDTLPEAIKELGKQGANYQRLTHVSDLPVKGLISPKQPLLAKDQGYGTGSELQAAFLKNPSVVRKKLELIRKKSQEKQDQKKKLEDLEFNLRWKSYPSKVFRATRYGTQ